MRSHLALHHAAKSHDRNVFAQVFIRFDGIYMNADIWFNGNFLLAHPYGYTTFQLDLTPHVQAGENSLAVRVRNGGQNSRW